MPLRIVSGKLKNKKLKVDYKNNVKPVKEIVRHGIFDTLGSSIENSLCLDLYAGSGSLGLEAISRGARGCDFVENHPEIAGVLRQNIKACNAEDLADVYVDDSVKFAANTPQQYDFIFLDPFYAETKLTFLFQNLENRLNKDGIIIYSHKGIVDFERLFNDTKLQVRDNRKYGITTISFINKHAN
jgi:16S rRNA (guanine966-N2)-methyltransferase